MDKLSQCRVQIVLSLVLVLTSVGAAAALDPARAEREKRPPLLGRASGFCPRLKQPPGELGQRSGGASFAYGFQAGVRRFDFTDRQHDTDVFDRSQRQCGSRPRPALLGDIAEMLVAVEVGPIIVADARTSGPERRP